MRYLFIPVIMLCGVELVTVHPTRANDLEDLMIEQGDAEIMADINHREEMCAITHSSQWCDAPASRPAKPHHYWTDLVGGRHDCAYDKPIPGLGDLFGAHCP